MTRRRPRAPTRRPWRSRQIAGGHGRSWQITADHGRSRQIVGEHLAHGVMCGAWRRRGGRGDAVVREVLGGEGERIGGTGAADGADGDGDGL